MIQVLGNLVSNALRYTPAGGTITLCTRDKSSVLGAEPTASRSETQHSTLNTQNSIVFEVRDSGSGIPPDALPHIFERLYRADASRVDKHGGSGLGLAIVKAIVEAHGGSVSAESVAGQGTRMAIWLPFPAHAAR